MADLTTLDETPREMREQTEEPSRLAEQERLEREANRAERAVDVADPEQGR
jgi:hypothetical protein